MSLRLFDPLPFGRCDGARDALALHPLAAKLAQHRWWNGSDDLHCKQNHFFCVFLKGIFTLKIEELIGVECLKAILEYKGKILLEFDFPEDMETGRVHMELDSDSARKVAQFLLRAADGIDGVINHTLN
ncbi:MULTISPECIES: hypothetical protein [Ochrobactrum]|uniref:Uncharacterized protein n=1 Tax=Ochrobactrum quorumnocens TaxID=271865 RepID=A0A5N1JR61_9HYPH|nr:MULTISPECIES: hypothetical protein [Brucella/Ochrobactrum group]KAA9361522.1 hypothetical protein F3W84_19970 [[Ochrobactrum] quorumnocens]MBD7993022.1 hypothetical protein [Ochrobactrum gallinarum]MDH7793610.1 hypothetical protein [Ochrobactrum sp. AN78]